MYDFSLPPYTILTETYGIPSYEPAFPHPKPSCTVDIADCTSLMVSYMCQTSLWNKAQTTATTSFYENNRYCDWKNIPTPTAAPTIGKCWAPGMFGGNTVTQWRQREQCGQCIIFAGKQLANAQLMYFPVTGNVSRNMCATTKTDTPVWGFHSAPTLTSVPTNRPHETAGQASAVVSGTTYYANSAYVRYPYIEARDDCGNIGPMLTDAVVTLRSSEVYSNRGRLAYDAYTFNFADYIEPVPYAAYLGMQECLEDIGGPQVGACQKMMTSYYSPQIAMPQQVRTLHPSWYSCTVSWVGVMDPPIALTAVKDFLPQPSTSSPAPNPVDKTTKIEDKPPGPSAQPVTTRGSEQPIETGGGGGKESANVPPRPGPSANDPDRNTPNPQPTGGQSQDPNRPEQNRPNQPNQPNQPGQPGQPNNQPPSSIWTSFTSVGQETVWLNPSRPGTVRIGTDVVLTPGASTTNFQGVSVSLGSSNNLVVGSSTINIPQNEATPYVATQAVITLGPGTVITAAPTGVVISGTTLLVGGAPVVVESGKKTISLASTGVVVIGPEGTSTVRFSTTTISGSRTNGLNTGPNGGNGPSNTRNPAQATGSASSIAESRGWIISSTALLVVLASMCWM